MVETAFDMLFSYELSCFLFITSCSLFMLHFLSMFEGLNRYVPIFFLNLAFTLIFTFGNVIITLHANQHGDINDLYHRKYIDKVLVFVGLVNGNPLDIPKKLYAISPSHYFRTLALIYRILLKIISCVCKMLPINP